MTMTIIAERWICTKCGIYFYINKGAGVFTGANCPICWQRTAGKYIKDVKIIV
jgi:rubrerythrin